VEWLPTGANNTIRKLIPVGDKWVTTTIGGLAGTAGSSDGINSEARFFKPMGIAVDLYSGNVYVADTGNNTIRMGVPISPIPVFPPGPPVFQASGPQGPV
jgi:DNA-binding beta-propeller fold protein YncE